MTRARISSPGLVWLLMAVALLLRGAVPVGWMPTSDEHGIRIALCSGAGAIELPVAGDRDHGPDDSAPRDPCPYGIAFAASLDVPPAPLAVLPPAAQEALTGPVLHAARLAARDSLRPPARGPPTFA